MRGWRGLRVKHLVVAIAILGGSGLGTQAHAAAGECFLRVDGVAGDSMDARHRGEIELVTWSLAMTMNSGPLASSGAGSPAMATGRADFQPLKILHRVDRSVPVLVQLAASGQHVPSAILTCRRSGARDLAEYLRVTLTEAFVTGVRLSDAADAPPSAETTLAYARITIEYRPQMPDGTLGAPVVSGWDVRMNRRQ